MNTLRDSSLLRPTEVARGINRAAEAIIVLETRLRRLTAVDPSFNCPLCRSSGAGRSVYDSTFRPTRLPDFVSLSNLPVREADDDDDDGC